MMVTEPYKDSLRECLKDERPRINFLNLLYVFMFELLSIPRGVASCLLGLWKRKVDLTQSKDKIIRSIQPFNS